MLNRKLPWQSESFWSTLIPKKTVLMSTKKRTSDIELDAEESIDNLDISAVSAENRDNSANSGPSGPSSFAGLLLKPEILKGLDKAVKSRFDPPVNHSCVSDEDDIRLGRVRKFSDLH